MSEGKDFLGSEPVGKLMLRMEMCIRDSYIA